MFEGTYFIPAHQSTSQKKYVSFSSPLQLNEDTSIWSTIDQNLKEQAAPQKKTEPKLLQKILQFIIPTRSREEYVPWKEDSYLLMSGTINLINFLIEQDQRNSPITTLVFLDKSARPASYLFRKVWEILSEKGIIDHQVHIPRIRFINMGTETSAKLNLNSPQELHYNNVLSSPHFNPNQKRILVVDEVIHSGYSAVSVANYLEKYLNVPVDSISYLNKLPYWFSNGTWKNIKDPLISLETYHQIEEIDFERLVYIQNLIKKLKHLSFEQKQILIETAMQKRKLEFDTVTHQYKADLYLEKSDLDQFFETLSTVNDPINSFELLEYLLTEGGLLARPQTDSSAIKQSKKFRILLEELAKKGAQFVSKSA